MTKEESQHLDKVASLGCIICRDFLEIEDSPACIHHIRTGIGKGQRATHFQTIPLCWQHHQGPYGVGFHSGKKIWETNFCSELELLDKVLCEVI